MVHSLGARVTLCTPKPLTRILKTISTPLNVISEGDTVPDFDFYCPLASLPNIFDTTLHSIPATAPYLFADLKKVTEWRMKLGIDPRLRIGIAWSTTTIGANATTRSIPLKDFSVLLDTRIEWHSLQVNYRRDDLAVLSRIPQIKRHERSQDDLSDTAALIETVDLVVSVDTSVAHLAGAMNKPTWLLLPYHADFRWLLDRTTSPWYPSLRIFRQTESRTWAPVLESVYNELTKLL